MIKNSKKLEFKTRSNSFKENNCVWDIFNFVVFLPSEDDLELTDMWHIFTFNHLQFQHHGLFHFHSHHHLFLLFSIILFFLSFLFLYLIRISSFFLNNFLGIVMTGIIFNVKGFLDNFVSDFSTEFVYLEVFIK